MTTTLSSDIHRADAARALVCGRADLPTLDAKVDLMQIDCRLIGENQYSAFLRALAEAGSTATTMRRHVRGSGAGRCLG